MKKSGRLYCIFFLPILVLLVYLGAALSNVLPSRTPEELSYDDDSGLTASEAFLDPGEALDGAFKEPDWIDFDVCRLLYEELSEDGKTAYRALYGAVLDHKEMVYIPSLSAEELSDVHAALKYDNPQLPCISDEFSYGSFGALFYVKLQYDYSKTECDALSTELVASARSICAACEGMNAYEKELYIHDALVRMAEYQDGGINSNTAAGVLVDRKAVCAGYALGMKLMCDITGIDSCVVRGTAVNASGSEAHAWLVVNVNDAWYHVDPTWDDPVNESDRNQLTHAYFNIPTDWISADHLNFRLPAGIRCDSTEDNYYRRSGRLCGWDDWRSVIKDAVEEQFPSLPCDVEFRFADADLFDMAYEELVGGEINTIINEIIRENDYSTERWRVSSQMFGDMNTLRFIISEYTD